MTIDNQTLINQIKANLTLKNTSLNRVCLDNAIDPSNALKALKGEWKGERASEICELLINTSQIEVEH